MKCKAFLCTLAVGLAAGAALSVMALPKRQRSHTMAGKILKVMGEIAEDIGAAVD